MKRCLQMMLLQRTVLEDFPLFCPKCRQERIINVRNFQIEIMIHQPLIGGNGVHGPVTDIQIVTEQMQKTKQRLTRILSENTGRPFAQVAADTERDNYMSAEEALAYVLIDKIIDKR